MTGDLEHSPTDFCLSGNQLFVMTVAFQENVSLAYVYTESSGTWHQSDGFQVAFQDQLYTRIEVDGDNLFAGSTSYILQVTRKFPVLYYKRENGIWNYKDNYIGNGPLDDDYFDEALVSHGNKLIIGAPKDGMPLLRGRAYYLDMNLATTGFEKTTSTIYPNPTANVLNIKSSSKIEKVELYSVTGSLLLSQSGNVSQLSLENVASGIYFVKLLVENAAEETFKVIKK